MEMTRLTGQRIALYILFFMVLVGPSFFPFKVPFVGQDDVSQWVAYSFAINIGLLAVLMVVPHFRTTVATSFGPLKRPFEKTSMTCLRVGVSVWWCFFLMILVIYLVGWPLTRVLPDVSVFRYPKIDSGAVYWVEITVGLAFGAVCEEFAFRSVIRRLIEFFTDNRILIVVISAAIYGLAHWRFGLPNVAVTTLYGVILMVAYLRLGTILPPILAHYFLNVWIFV